jgi:hypothetical protein
MDLNSAYSQAGVSASVIFAGGILYRIYRSVNGKRCRSKCCGYDMELDFKVDDMPPTPPQENFVVNNPLPHPPHPSQQLHPPHS